MPEADTVLISYIVIAYSRFEGLISTQWIVLGAVTVLGIRPREGLKADEIHEQPIHGRRRKRGFMGDGVGCQTDSRPPSHFQWRHPDCARRLGFGAESSLNLV